MFTDKKNKHILLSTIQTAIKLICCGIFFIVFNAKAAEVKYEQTSDKADISIFLPPSTDYEVETQNDKLLLSFNSPLAEDMQKTQEKLNSFVQSQKISEDKQSIELQMKVPYSVRTAYNNGILQIEILRQTSTSNTNDQANKGVILDYGEHEGYERLSFSYVSKPHYAVKADKNASIISFLSPVEFNWEKIRETNIYPYLEQYTNQLGGTDIKIPHQLLKSFEYNNKIVLDIKKENQTSQTEKAENKSLNIITERNALGQQDNIGMENKTVKDEVASLAFPWNMEVGVSVFQRGKYIWIAFDHQRTLDLDDLRNQSKNVTEQIIQVPHSKATILRILPKPNVRVGLRQEGLLWIIDLYTHNIDYKVRELPIFVQYNSMNQSYLYIPNNNSGNALSIIDPEVGDMILIGTETELGLAIDEAYRYQDLEILPAKQGFAIVPNASDIMLTKGNTGFSIKADNRGLNISDNLDNIKRQQQFLQKASDIFDLNIPAQLLQMNFLDAEKQIKEDIAKSKQEQQIRAKLLLIRYYLGMGLGTEAMQALKQLSPEEKQKVSPETYAALSGVANFLMRRYDEALDNFSVQGLQNNNEAIFWRALTDSALEFKKENDIVLLTFITIIRDYPQELKERIALVAADTTIKAYDDISTQNFLDILKSSKNNDARRAQILYLNAQKFEYQGYPNNALKEYSYATMHKSQKYASLARFSKVDLEDRFKLINPKRAIEELERLRFAWGEENFKFKLLQRLAEIYESDKNYNKALLTYQQSLNLAQTPSQKEDILNKMLKLFEDLYMNGRVDELQAVKAIALYKDYEWLAPRSRYYTAMAQKLADRMVAVDLLTSASDLLKEQLRLVNLSPDQKAQIGARLALIYLFEEDAIAALDILDKTQTKDLSQNQQQYRKIIKAKALAYLNKTDEALKLLEDDFSKNALLLKTDIYWKSGQWEKAANTIKYLIEKPQKDTPLTSEQRTYILDWIIALKKANRSTVIYRIRNTFLSYFEKTPYYSTFNILTSNLETNRVDMNSIDKAVNDISAYSNFSKIYDESLLKSLPQQPENKEAGEK